MLKSSYLSLKPHSHIHTSGESNSVVIDECTNYILVSSIVALTPKAVVWTRVKGDNASFLSQTQMVLLESQKHITPMQCDTMLHNLMCIVTERANICASGEARTRMCKFCIEF